MDPLTAAILEGLLTNGLYSILFASGTRVLNTISGRARNQDSVLNDIKNVVGKSLGNLQTDGVTTQETREFLSRPEVSSIVRQIFSVNLISSEPKKSVEDIRIEFSEAYANFLGVESDQLPVDVNDLFDEIASSCESSLSNLITDKGLIAHEAKSDARLRIILDELETIKRSIDLSKKKPGLKEIDNYLALYRKQMADRYGYITPQSLDHVEKVPIDDLYVCPNFSAKATNEQHFVEYTIDNFILGMYRSVLLGNPGGGKSTFAAKLSYDLSLNKQSRMAGRIVVPVLVVLRDYASHKYAHSSSFLSFIETVCVRDLQLPEPPAHFFEHLFLTGSALVIFDGLDELLETSSRRAISSDVESFCTLYPAVPILVTSRQVGYDEAPLDQKRFDVFTLSSFNDEQVTEYVTKWFANHTDLSLEVRQQKTQSFLQESKIVPDLRSNPLMLSLMCNIYRGDGYIPKNRPDVYEKCANMLFERWDKGRGIQVDLPFESHIRPGMMHLAFSIYENVSSQSGVTEDTLIKATSSFLHGRRYQLLEDAVHAARQFVEFLRGRAWVFTDTGTTAEGDKLYQFTHRTFLEYFAACYIVQNHPTPQKLRAFLEKRIARREWDVVSQLACQIQNKSVLDAGSDILGGLLTRSTKLGGRGGYNIVWFVLRCLAFLVPSPDITAKAVRMVLDNCLMEAMAMNALHTDTRTSKASRQSEKWQETLDSLFDVSRENLSVVAAELGLWIEDRIVNASVDEAILAFEIAEYFSIEMNRPGYSAAKDLGSSVESSINVSRTRLLELGATDLHTGIDLFFRKNSTLRSLVAHHGIKALFEDRPYTMFGMRRWPIAEYVGHVSFRAFPKNPSAEAEWQNICIEIGQLFLEDIENGVLSPFSSTLPSAPDLLYMKFDGNYLGTMVQYQLTSSCYFGLTLIYGIYLERKLMSQKVSKVIQELRDDTLLLPEILRQLLLARCSRDIGMAEQAISNAGLSNEQTLIVKRWIAGEFVLPTNSDSSINAAKKTSGFDTNFPK